MLKKFIHLGLLLCVTCSALPAKAQDLNALLGPLKDALRPEIREDLGLTDEQFKKLKELQSRRLSGAITLAQQLREATVSQADELTNEFAAETERLMRTILNEEQAAKVERKRIQSAGMMALRNDRVAEQLNLSDKQRELVNDWASKVRAAARSPQEGQTRAKAQREIRKALSESQWINWQVLAGEVDPADAPKPEPPMPAKAAPMVAAGGAGDAGATPVQMPAKLAPTADATKVPIGEVRLVINFQNTPWRDVIDWLASQADMSVQNDIVPPGSFTYRDAAETYTVTETLDVMNATLLDKGYTIFRQGRMLRCLNFETQEFAGEVLSELADMVDTEELAKRGDYEPVKCFFSLKRLDPEELIEEIEQLISIQGRVVSLPATGQLMVTDMAKNVQAIAEMIRRAEDPASVRGAAIQRWVLDHITAEEILTVARPHLGLEEGVNVSDEITISTNAFGTTLYAKGAADKIQDLQDLVTQMDVEPEGTEDNVSTAIVPVLQRHQVVGIDLQLAYDVVSQLLAGSPGVRLATNEVSKQLILQARPEEHDLVRTTLQELSGEISDFEVIQLESLDTLLAIEAIKKFFNLTDDADGEGGGPVIDGAPMARQVWVKGTDTQIKQIRSLLDKLEANSSTSELDGIVLYPGMKGDALEQVKAIWEMRNGGRNPIRQIGGGSPRRTSGIPERRLPRGVRGTDPNAEVPPWRRDSSNEKSEESKPAGAAPAADSGKRAALQGGELPLGKFVAQQADDTAASPSDNATAEPEKQPAASDSNGKAAEQSNAPIMIMEGPTGLIIASDDPKVLAEFDTLLRMVTDQAALAVDEPTVIYLTNVTASAAKELLETILSGSSGSSAGGGLLGDMAGAMLGGGLGALLGGGGGGGDLLSGSTGIASGDYSITADPRLNCLIVKASPADMALIEQLVEIIDQVESPYSIETRGTIKMIPIISQEVDDVLAIVKSVFGDRIQGAASSAGGGGGRGGQPDPAALIQALRGGGRGGRGGSTSTELAEPKISLAADTKTNMLIVGGQPSQIAEVEDLVKQLDYFAEAEAETLASATLGGFKSSVYESAIGRILGPNAKTNSTESTSSGSSSSSSSSSGGGESDAAAAQRRAAFFEALRNRGGGGAAFGGRGGGTPTGGRGGGAPTGGRGGGAPGGGAARGGGGRGR